MKTGCELWDDCSTCPYPDCIANNKRKAEAIRHIKEVTPLWQKGYTVKQIVRQVGILVEQFIGY